MWNCCRDGDPNAVEGRNTCSPVPATCTFVSLLTADVLFCKPDCMFDLKVPVFMPYRRGRVFTLLFDFLLPSSFLFNGTLFRLPLSFNGFTTQLIISSASSSSLVSTHSVYFNLVIELIIAAFLRNLKIHISSTDVMPMIDRLRAPSFPSL